MHKTRRVPTMDEYLAQRQKEKDEESNKIEKPEGCDNQNTTTDKPINKPADTTNTDLTSTGSSSEMHEALNTKVISIFMKQYMGDFEKLISDFIGTVKSENLDYKDEDIRGMIGIATKDALKKIK